MIYDADSLTISTVFDAAGSVLGQAYDANGNPLMGGFVGLFQYKGGYIEIQPDSWDGSTPVTGNIVSADDPLAWGFPWSLSAASKAAIKADILNGGGYGVMYVRFPLGFAYRGSRNIDAGSGLAKNIGERWTGQNSTLAAWFSSIVQAGGGIAPEYWCVAPYWTTAGAYSGTGNTLWAGGSYSRSTTLDSIRTSNPTQYAVQIDALTDAMLDDLEYLHTNVAPVRMFGLECEPKETSVPYGKIKYGSAQLYSDVLEALWPKVLASSVLSAYNGEPNTVLLHAASAYDSSPWQWLTTDFINNHASWLWGYSQDAITRTTSGETGAGADYYATSAYSNIKGSRENVFTCEYEYFNVNSVSNMDFRCSNNMLRLINELVFGHAEVLHPIIHICKPTGQESYMTNTVGYCLYAVDMSDGSYTVNAWAYNSWKMFNDNLPVGAYYINGHNGGTAGAGWCVFTHNDKLIVFMANNTSSAVNLTIPFGRNVSLTGKLYNLTNIGAPNGSSAGTFTVPAYSGLCYLEQ